MVSELVLLRPASVPTNDGFYVRVGPRRKKESLISDLKNFIELRFNSPRPQVFVGEDGCVVITGLYEGIPDDADYSHEIFDHILDLVGWIEGCVELPSASEEKGSDHDQLTKEVSMNELLVVEIDSTLKSDEGLGQTEAKISPTLMKESSCFGARHMLDEMPELGADLKTIEVSDLSDARPLLTVNKEFVGSIKGLEELSVHDDLGFDPGGKHTVLLAENSEVMDNDNVLTAKRLIVDSDISMMDEDPVQMETTNRLRIEKETLICDAHQMFGELPKLVNNEEMGWLAELHRGKRESTKRGSTKQEESNQLEFIVAKKPLNSAAHQVLDKLLDPQQKSKQAELKAFWIIVNPDAHILLFDPGGTRLSFLVDVDVGSNDGHDRLKITRLVGMKVDFEMPKLFADEHKEDVSLDEDGGNSIVLTMDKLGQKMKSTVYIAEWIEDEDRKKGENSILTLLNGPQIFELPPYSTVSAIINSLLTEFKSWLHTQELSTTDFRGSHTLELAFDPGGDAYMPSTNLYQLGNIVFEVDTKLMPSTAMINLPRAITIGFVNLSTLLDSTEFLKGSYLALLIFDPGGLHTSGDIVISIDTTKLTDIGRWFVQLSCAEIWIIAFLNVAFPALDPYLGWNTRARSKDDGFLLINEGVDSLDSLYPTNVQKLEEYLYFKLFTVDIFMLTCSKKWKFSFDMFLVTNLHLIIDKEDAAEIELIPFDHGRGLHTADFANDENLTLDEGFDPLVFHPRNIFNVQWGIKAKITSIHGGGFAYKNGAKFVDVNGDLVGKFQLRSLKEAQKNLQQRTFLRVELRNERWFSFELDVQDYSQWLAACSTAQLGTSTMKYILNCSAAQLLNSYMVNAYLFDYARHIWGASIESQLELESSFYLGFDLQEVSLFGTSLVLNYAQIGKLSVFVKCSYLDFQLLVFDPGIELMEEWKSGTNIVLICAGDSYDMFCINSYEFELMFKETVAAVFGEILMQSEMMRHSGFNTRLTGRVTMQFVICSIYSQIADFQLKLQSIILLKLSTSMEEQCSLILEDKDLFQQGVLLQSKSHIIHYMLLCNPVHVLFMHYFRFSGVFRLSSLAL